MLLNIKLYQVLIQYGCGEDPLEVLWKYKVHLKQNYAVLLQIGKSTHMGVMFLQKVNL